MKIDALLPVIKSEQMDTAVEPDDKSFGLGPVIREVRKRRRMTQGQLAIAIGLERTSVTNIERGSQRLQLSTLKAIADALNMNLTIKLEPKP